MAARNGTGRRGESSLAASIAALAFCRIASRFENFERSELCGAFEGDDEPEAEFMMTRAKGLLANQD